jgi:hypothetical protein
MRVKSKVALRGLRHRERVAKMNEAAPTGIRVVPAKDEYRGVLKHPKAGGFPAEGSKEWPDDRFTKRRLADGSVTREEIKGHAPESPPSPEHHDNERRQREQRSQSRHRVEHQSPDDPNHAA